MTIFEEGYSAYYKLTDRYCNPYSNGSDEYVQWENGWCKALDDDCNDIILYL